MTRSLRLLVWAGLCVCLHTAESAPRFAHVFGDHLVLQRDAPLPLWGFGADPDSADSLTIRFGNTTVVVKVGSKGEWKASLPAQATDPKGKPLVLRENGKAVVRIDDVVVGDVWLAAGQSNMQMKASGMLKGLPESADWIDSATRSEIRFRRVDDQVLDKREIEATDLSPPADWISMTPESVPNLSAVAAVFAREVADEVKVPVGIIDLSWGGKPIEPFIPRENFDSVPLLKRIRTLADAGKLDELAAIRGGVIIRNPAGYPGAIFNARMAPLVPFKLRGFLWYQAESNAGTGEDPRDYRLKMKALAEGWRARWQDETLPLYFVQLPSYPSATGWIRMREEQRRSLALIPNSGMAVTIDIRGEGIHPPDKIAVGRRLARLALVGTYGRKDLAAGPSYRDHEIRNGKVRVRFSHVGEGLLIGDKPGFGPPNPTPDGPLRWFELSAANGAWHPAQAMIDGKDTVVVTSDAVPNPVAVRYACATTPQVGNLYNSGLLPASPFCSDLELLPWEDPPRKR